jgi:hypothetical protein
MPRGGKRQGAGRPKGRKNGEGKPAKAINSKRTRAQTGQIVERALQHGDLTPLEAMLRNLRVIVAEAERMLEAGVPVTDKDHLTLRKLATETASAVAPFLHPKLSAIANLQKDASQGEADRTETRRSVDIFIERIRHLAAAQHRAHVADADLVPRLNGSAAR